MHSSFLAVSIICGLLKWWQTLEMLLDGCTPHLLLYVCVYVYRYPVAEKDTEKEPWEVENKDKDLPCLQIVMLATDYAATAIHFHQRRNSTQKKKHHKKRKYQPKTMPPKDVEACVRKEKVLAIQWRCSFNDLLLGNQLLCVLSIYTKPGH